MIGLLVSILILVLIAGVAIYIIGLLPLPPPWGQIAMALVGLIVILILIGILVGDVPLFGPRPLVR